MKFSSPEKKAEFIENYIKTAKIIAARMHARLPQHIERSEVESMAFLGLMDAAEKFSPDKNIKFETYAEWRIKGTILDGLRGLDTIPRGLRKNLKLMDKAYQEFEMLNGRAPEDEELAEKMEIDVEELDKLRNSLRGAALGRFIEQGNSEDGGEFEEGNISYLPDTESSDPFVTLKKKELIEMMKDRIENLSDREKMILSLYFFEELTMKEIGSVISLTESRVSQILTATLFKLRQCLLKHA